MGLLLESILIQIRAMQNRCHEKDQVVVAMALAMSASVPGQSRVYFRFLHYSISAMQEKPEPRLLAEIVGRGIPFSCRKVCGEQIGHGASMSRLCEHVTLQLDHFDSSVCAYKNTQMIQMCSVKEVHSFWALGPRLGEPFDQTSHDS